MANLNGFNAGTVEPRTEYEPIPAAKYAAVITKSEMKATKSGKGNYLELTFGIIEGQHKGRQLWARLNLDNPNTLAMQIAQSELSSICRAVGVLTPKDSSDLHDIPLTITVRQKVDQDRELRNEIRGYARQEGAQAARAPQAQISTPPWRRNPA